MYKNTRRTECYSNVVARYISPFHSVHLRKLCTLHFYFFNRRYAWLCTAVSCNQGHRDNDYMLWTLSSPLCIPVLVTHHHLLQTIQWGRSSWMAVLPLQDLIFSGCRCLCDNSSFGMVLSFRGKNKGNPDLHTSRWWVATWHFPTEFCFGTKISCFHKNQSLLDLVFCFIAELLKAKLNFLFVCVIDL